MPQVEFACSVPGCARWAMFPQPDADGAARAAGWHIGRVGRAYRVVRVVYCPPCMDPALGDTSAGLAS